MIKKILKTIKASLENRVQITDMLSLVIVTFGVVLLVAGTTLMVATTFGLIPLSQQNASSEFGVSSINLLPGVPFCINDLANYSLTTLGVVSWIFGLDLVLVGLGLWVRHKFARLSALVIFLLATVFNFLQFLLLGFSGAPMSVVQMFVNGVIVYFLYFKFETKDTPFFALIKKSFRLRR